jgi:hypothetical protein
MALRGTLTHWKTRRARVLPTIQEREPGRCLADLPVAGFSSASKCRVGPSRTRLSALLKLGATVPPAAIREQGRQGYAYGIRRLYIWFEWW